MSETKLIQLTLPVGTPLRVALLKKVAIGKVGRPVVALVIEPVYSFNRVVVPAGSQVDGKVIRIVPASKFRRAEAMMNGNFTPLATARIEFDTLVLKNGARMPIDTRVSPGIRDVIRLVAKQNRPVKAGLFHRLKRDASQQWHGALHQAKKIVSFRYVKNLAIHELPYHRRYLRRGTVFDADLLHPLRCGQETLTAGDLADYGDPPSANSVVEARLVTALSSATARKGTPVVAVITEPLYSRDRKLLLPEGARLEGVVVEAHPARHFHHNGLLRIAIHKMRLPSGAASLVDANVTGLAVGSGTHIQLDSEDGATIAEHKTRYLDTVLSLAIATSTFDSEAGRAAGGQGSDLTNRGLAGGSGFRMVGLVAGALVSSRIMGQALGIYGAAWSVYDHFIADGRNVVLRKDTPMTIAFGSQQPAGD
ncbi:MAG TPA: hypothetical protein VNJ12_03005 [Candidatus Dormibacteraeota bacterium]|nr:hypothetical protein [Candidatus Dormibacteraeota bacterium]